VKRSLPEGEVMQELTGSVVLLQLNGLLVRTSADGPCCLPAVRGTNPLFPFVFGAQVGLAS